MRRLWVSLLGSFLLIGAGLCSDEARAECFDEHLEGAIALNQSRAHHYSRISGGRTRALSDELIGMERDAKLLAFYYMSATQRWRDEGVPLFCSEFAPMSGAGKLVEAPVMPGPALRHFKTPRWKAFKSEASVILGYLQDTLRSPIPEAVGIHWWDLERRIEEEMESIGQEPRFHCMYRHMLESMLKIAHLAPRHAAESKKRGLESPEPWSVALLDKHLMVLHRTVSLDQRAAPIQADGIPFLCNDVPPL